ncbi:MAG: carbohydrate ABC transporter permease [Actinomycetota bacterium]
MLGVAVLNAERDGRIRLALLTPMTIGGLLLIVVPLIATITLAFFDYNAIESPRFSGLGNLRAIFGDPIFRTALFNTLLFVLVAVPIRLLVATATALLLAPDRRGAGLARSLVYLPTVVPEVAYGLLWLWMVNPINGPLAPLFGSALTTTAWGARGLVVALVTFQIGEAFLVALVARRDIPDAYLEQAAVDGASPWFAMRRITLPIMRPVLLLLAARDVVLAFQVSFVASFLLTEGGPFYATTTLPLYAYRTGFEYLRFGRAAAVTLVALVASAAMLAAQVLIIRGMARRVRPS